MTFTYNPKVVFAPAVSGSCRGSPTPLMRRVGLGRTDSKRPAVLALCADEPRAHERSTPSLFSSDSWLNYSQSAWGCWQR